MTFNEEDNKSVKTIQELTQILELADKHIKMFIKYLLQNYKDIWCRKNSLPRWQGKIKCSQEEKP